MYSVAQNISSLYPDPELGAAPATLSTNAAQRIRQRIQLQIPQKYAQEPVISNLIRHYEIEVNIHSALLATNAQESGWFDLELYGIPERIQQSLDYLAQLHVEIWDGDRNAKTDWIFS
jgi:ABC-type methionine transport system ATPase subunit